MRLRTARTVCVVVALSLSATAACSGNDDASTGSNETTTVPSSAADTGTDGSTTSTAGTDSSVTSRPRPEGAPADNTLELLGDALGMVDSCAGRSATGDVEYRYGLTNGGTFVITLDAGQPAMVVYDGFSGRFEGAGEQLGEATTGDGFVTGTGTLQDGGGTTTDVAYRATVPIENCDTASADTVPG